MICFGFCKTELGLFLAGARAGRLCWVSPVPAGADAAFLDSLRRFAGGEGLCAGHDPVCALLQEALRWALHGEGGIPSLDMGRATAFQRRVWAALMEIGPGERITYGGLAGRLGMPGAARAVGNAVAANVLAVVVPCHRVVGGQGAGGYRWGRDRKEDFLAFEENSKNTENLTGPVIADTF